MDTPAVVPPKPGIKTSEFWLSLGMIVASTVLGGVRDTGGTIGTIAGLVASGIAAAGYSVSRALVKSR